MPNYHTEVGGAIDATHTYYNITIRNDNANTQESQPIIFNESRNVPILINPSEHFMSVMRFTLETTSLPVFTPVPLIGSTYSIVAPLGFDTIYRVTYIPNGGSPVSSNVKWVSQDSGVAPVSVAITQKQYTNPYFYCYSYLSFISLVNEAIQRVTGLTSTAPAVYYDATTQLFSVSAPVDLFRTRLDGGLLGTAGRLFFNTALFNLMASLKSVYVANTLGNGIDYQIPFFTGTDIPGATQPYITNVYNNSLTSSNWVSNVAEYPTVSLWTPVKTIIFKTSLLTNVPELQGKPEVKGLIVDNSLGINPAVNIPPADYGVKAGANIPFFGTPTTYAISDADVLNILIEHSVELYNGTENKPYIYYEPVGEFRLTDLYGIQPVNQMDISVFWKDAYGNLNPVYLPIGSSASIKILFRKKIFNSDLI
jgi:hypothetical protein